MISCRFLIMVLVIPVMTFLSCSTKVKSATATSEKKPAANSMALPPCIFYKTRADYKMNVPVSLSEDKTRIISYPDVLDIRHQGGAAYPTELVNGYLLDNRGIGTAVAFLSFTYDDYAKLNKTPSLDELMKHIIDKDPLIEMYRCKTRNNEPDLVSELSRSIETGKMSGFIRLK